MSGSTSHRARRSVFQRVVIVANLGVMIAFLAAAGGLAYTYSKYGQIPRVEIAEYLSDAGEIADGDGAENFLMVGVDSADGLSPDDPVRSSRAQVGGLRSDTIMILRVDPASTRAALLSIPRDLAVPIAGTGRTDKINSAVHVGGPEALIQTIQDYFGIPINHYVQIDFSGFAEVVEALDGVPLYFPHPVRDVRSGLRVPEAGCVTLDARNALGFVRSRAYQERIDGRWWTDGSGDLGRITRQQEFIVRALERAIDQGLRNPVTLDSLIDSALGAVTIDDTLDGDDILDLGSRFRDFSPSSLDLYELPVGAASRRGGSDLALDTRAAEPVLDIFRNTDPAAVTPSTVRVRVLNGTGEPGQAADTAAALRDVGFAIGGAGDASSIGDPRTEIRHPPGEETAADLLTRWLVNGARLVEDRDVVDVTLVTGRDYAGLRAEPRPPPSTSSTTLPRATTTSTPTSTSASQMTTTSVVGTIPPEPPPGVDCG